MKEKYTQQNLDQFFNQFRALPNSYNLEKLHKLINDPSLKPKNSIKLKYKSFKFIIMTSAIIIGLTSIIIWLTPNTNINKAYEQDLKIKQIDIPSQSIDKIDHKIIIPFSIKLGRQI